METLSNVSTLHKLLPDRDRIKKKSNHIYLHTVAPGGAGLALILGLFESSLSDKRG